MDCRYSPQIPYFQISTCNEKINVNIVTPCMLKPYNHIHCKVN